VRPQQCDNLDIDNIKLIGFWRYNADGIDVVNSKNVTIRNCFVRAYDDNIVVKGLPAAYKDNRHRNVENLKVDNCVLWNDWGRALEIGAETVADTIKNISFTNCYIPRFTFIALDIQNGDKAWVKNVRFENIFIEEPILDSARMANKPEDISRMAKTLELKIIGHYALKNDSFPGKISDIYFKNIHYNSTRPTFCNFLGFNPTHIVNNVFIRDYFINEKKVTDQTLLRKNEFVGNVKLE
jgi:polygalacturonase